MTHRIPLLTTLGLALLSVACSADPADSDPEGNAGSGNAAGASGSGGEGGGVGGSGVGGSGVGGSSGASGSGGASGNGGSSGSGGTGGASGNGGGSGSGGTGGASGNGGSSGSGGSGGGTPGACTIADTSGCVPATTLNLLDEQFLCNKPLSSWGPLPLKVVIDFTPGVPFGENGAVDLTTGCAGDGDPNSIDLIVDVRGDGKTYGPGVDAFKVRLQAGYTAGIQLTGHVDCGPRFNPTVHQDGVQLQGGRDIAFVDFSVGDYDGGWSTCQGAGGAFFYSGAGGYAPENIDVIRGKYIACNHALLAGTPGSSGEVIDASFRSGRTDGTDPLCVGFAASNPCIDTAPNVTLTNLTCQQWSSSSNQWN